MVVCKFFQQGYCRYGQNCRFEHIYGSKYTYHANPPAQTQPTQLTNVDTDEQLVNQVQSDIQAALKGGQWIISSYAPFKEKPSFPGLTDLSPEEARLFVYEAKAKNTVDQAINYVDNLFKEARYKYEQLLQPTVNTIQILRSLYKGGNVSSSSSPSSAFGATNNAASSLFRNALTNASTSIFNQNANKSIFSPNSDSTVAKSIFAQANQSSFGLSSQTFFQTNPNESTPKSLFAQENQKIFGNQTPSNNPTNIFASASQNIFGKPMDPSGQSNVFSSQLSPNIFQKPDQPKDVFQRTDPKSIFGTASTILEQKTSTHTDIYSELKELSQDDLEAFKSKDFKLGFIPEVPPAQSLCF